LVAEPSIGLRIPIFKPEATELKMERDGVAEPDGAVRGGAARRRATTAAVSAMLVSAVSATAGA